MTVEDEHAQREEKTTEDSRAVSQSRLMTFSEMGIFSRITSRDENSHETS